MPDPKLINYYSVLNLPPDADLVGVENAYARLSEDLVTRMDVDEGSAAALRGLNEAYSVLSKPDLRREYDRVLFVKERADLEARLKAEMRKRVMVGRVIVATLVLMTLVEGAGVFYFFAR